jgi:hypothetical protein
LNEQEDVQTGRVDNKTNGCINPPFKQCLTLFPNATEASKFSEGELFGLLEWSLPATWRAKFDLDGYIPTLHSRARLIEACEAIEQSKTGIWNLNEKKVLEISLTFIHREFSNLKMYASSKCEVSLRLIFYLVTTFIATC